MLEDIDFLRSKKCRVYHTVSHLSRRTEAKCGGAVGYGRDFVPTDSCFYAGMMATRTRIGDHESKLLVTKTVVSPTNVIKKQGPIGELATACCNSA